MILKRTAAAAAVAIVALLTAGCTGSLIPPDATPSPSASAGGDAEGGPGVDDEVAPAIVTQTVVPDERFPENTSEIGIQSLTVDGPIMTLEFVMTPDFGTVEDDEFISSSDVAGAGIFFVGSQMKLIDRENLKEYSVIYSGGKWWQFDGSIRTLNGDPIQGFVVFAAPEDDIDTVDLVFNPRYPEFTDVPITQAEQ